MLLFVLLTLFKIYEQLSSQIPFHINLNNKINIDETLKTWVVRVLFSLPMYNS